MMTHISTSFPRRRESSASDSEQESFDARTRFWIPAFAGMTLLCCFSAPAYATNLLNPSGKTNLLNESGNKNLLNEGGNSNLLSGDNPLCKSIDATPSADVAYKPGADANGHYVAPADVDGGAVNMMPKKIDIPLTISLANALHLNTNAAPYNQLGAGTEAVIGTISVEGNKVSYNGQSLSNDQQNNLKAMCKK